MTNLVFLPKNTQDFCFVHASYSSNKMNYTMYFAFNSLDLIFFINSLPISHFFSLTYRYRNNEYENDSADSLGLDFERAIALVNLVQMRVWKMMTYPELVEISGRR